MIIKKKIDNDFLNQLNEISKISYSPYSKFRVVAFFINNDNSSFYGVNIENASYPNCLCAERVALVSEINKRNKINNVKEIYIYSPDSNDFLSPCGGCRQSMSELMNRDFIVHMVNKNGEYISEEFEKMFPFPISKENIKGKN